MIEWSRHLDWLALYHYAYVTAMAGAASLNLTRFVRSVIAHRPAPPAAGWALFFVLLALEAMLIGR